MTFGHRSVEVPQSLVSRLPFECVRPWGKGTFTAPFGQHEVQTCCTILCDLQIFIADWLVCHTRMAEQRSADKIRPSEWSCSHLVFPRVFPLHLDLLFVNSYL